MGQGEARLLRGLRKTEGLLAESGERVRLRGLRRDGIGDAAYKVLDLYRDLPRTNCRECGKAGCFAFAGAVFLEDFPPSACPYLPPEALAHLAPSQGTDDESEDAKLANAIARRLAQVASADLAGFAARAGASFAAGPPPTATLDLFRRPHRVTASGVIADGDAPEASAQFVVLDCLLCSQGQCSAGVWRTFRDLPDTASTAKAFDACVARLTQTFAGRLAHLDRALHALKAETAEPGSASLAYRIRALPRVELLLLFWDRVEDLDARAAAAHPVYGRFTSLSDFDARAEILWDRDVQNHLSPEACLHLARVLVRKLVEEAGGHE